MVATDSARHDNHEPPKLRYAFAELPRALIEFATLLPGHFLLRDAPRGDGHAVITVPGYRAGDNSMGFLQRYLQSWNYDPRPWGLGTNMGIGFDRLDYEKRFVAQLERIADETGEQVSLIGWSQGGVIARQVAKIRGDLIRQVITLGSPIGGTPEASTIWRIYERMSPDEITEELMEMLREVASPVPNVRCTCIYSMTDGVVAPQIAQDKVSPLAENICVRASHSGMAVNPAVLYVIADRLAQPDENWQPFDARTISRMFCQA